MKLPAYRNKSQGQREGYEHCNSSNQLKMYVARSQHIPSKSDDEHTSESDGEDGESQELPIGTTTSSVSSDADTILHADYENDKGIPGHTNVPILAHTSNE